jgi:hypothetical protein
MATLPIIALPHATRNEVFSALFQRLKLIPAPGNLQWRKFSQKLVIWTDVPGDNQPCLFLYRGPQIASQVHAFGVTKWQWKCWIWIYYRIDSLQCAGDDLYPDLILDNILDSVEQVFQTDPLIGRLTLDGTCWHCWIDGSIVFDDGIVDNQAVVVIPVSILV